MTEPDDDLERRVRASLDARAAEVDTTVALTFGGRTSHRHRHRWLALGAAVAAATAAVTVPVVVLGGHEPNQAPPTPATEIPSPSDTPWRTEYWRGISVDVPATWEWGAGPRARNLMRCGGPNDEATPYVGRPVFMSDACMVRLDPDPQAPYVWLGAPIEPGTVDVGTDYTEVTVERDGTTVTVGSDDDALRDRILSSVTTQDLCPATIPSGGPDVGGLPVEGVGAVQTFRLCAYDRSRLMYGADLGQEGYARWQEALPDDLGDEVSTGCPQHDEKVVLAGTFDDPFGTEPIALTWVVDVACNLVSSAYGDTVGTPAMRRVWADQGVRSVLPTFINPWR